MGLQERLEFLVTLNADGAIKGFGNVGDAAEKGLKNTESKLDKTAGSMVKFGAGAVAAAGVVGAALWQTGEAAGDLSAAISANKQVLGDSSAAVVKWAEGSVKAVGLSQRAAVEASTSFGQFAKVAGETGTGVSDFSIEMVKLASDMAAFANVSPEQAIDDLKSAFAGSTEVMGKYAVNINEASLKQAYLDETGIKVTGTLTAQQKTIAVHADLLKKTSDMQGQWNREIDSAESKQAMAKASWEDLQASIGKAFIPVMTTALDLVQGGIKAFTNLNEATGGMVGQFATIATVGVGALGAISAISGKVIQMRDKFSDAEGGLTSFGKAASGVAIGLGAVTAVMGTFSVIDLLRGDFADLSDEMNKFLATTAESAKKKPIEVLNAFEDLTQGVMDTTSSMDGAADAFDIMFTNASKAEKWGDAMGGAFDQVMTKSPEAAQNIIDMIGATVAFGEAGDENAAKWAHSYNLTSDVIKGWQQKLDDATGAQDALTESTGAATDATDANSSSEEDAARATANATEVKRILTDGINAATDAVNAHNDALEEEKQRVEDLYNTELSQVDAKYAFRRATEDNTDALLKYNETMADSKATTIDQRDATNQAFDSAIAMSEAFARASGAASGSAASVDAQVRSLSYFRDSLTPGSALRAALDEYINDLKKIPASISTTLKLNMQYAGDRAFGDVAFGGAAQAAAEAAYKKALQDALGPGKAAGGPVMAGKTYPVGEKGVELFTPSQNGSIVPNHKLGGQTLTVHIAQVNDPVTVDALTSKILFKLSGV